MVKPVDFGFNEQTGLDNEFQNRPASGEESIIRKQAQQEFEDMVSKLESNGIEVIVLGKPNTKESLPDAVFPNNWFSTRNDGSLFIYPMKTRNRQAEVQIEPLIQALTSSGYKVANTIDLRQEFQNGNKTQILEGTGCLIFHHSDSKVFAAISERCEEAAFEKFCQSYGYKANVMYSQSAKGAPIYHTNVLMSCGDKFAVIAKSTLSDDSRSKESLNVLKQTVEDVIEISEEQMASNFCGNILQLKSSDNTPCIVMSESAFDGFTTQQVKILEKHGQLIPCSIPTIETVGGGSARCMIAENFLPTA